MKSKIKKDNLWDVVVIGGGPAGMMAAGRASERGQSVVLLEKNPALGKKLLITGGGRCNLTNNKPDIRTMLSYYRESGKFLFSAFSQFGVADAIDFFNKRGMVTKIEEEDRVFPVSNKAQSVLDVLELYMKEGGVDVRTNSAVESVSTDKKTGNFSVKLKDKTKITAKSCIMATGGTSRPETGSTGEAFPWLKNIGHSIVENSVALVPVALKDSWAKDLSGLTLQDIKLTVFQNGKKQDSQKGKMLFTHFGISGPAVLNMSKDIGEALKYGEVVILLDLFPRTDQGILRKQLQALLVEESNKKIKNTLDELVPAKLAAALLKIAGIDGETANHSVRSEDRTKLAALMKAVPLNVGGLLGSEKAIVSSGGVDLKEVDFKKMQSRLVPNLYLIGDVLNINRNSGGYSLQVCWTTGYVAGSNC